MKRIGKMEKKLLKIAYKLWFRNHFSLLSLPLFNEIKRITKILKTMKHYIYDYMSALPLSHTPGAPNV